MRPWGSKQFLADLVRWRDEDPATGARVVRLVEETCRDPRRGTGRPKRLTGIPSVWSRRITQAHRLFYEIDGDEHVHFIQCYGHDLPAHVIAEKRREFAARMGGAA